MNQIFAIQQFATIGQLQTELELYEHRVLMSKEIGSSKLERLQRIIQMML